MTPTVRRAAAALTLTAGFTLAGCGSDGCDDVAPTESLESVTVLADDDCSDESDD